ncbi:peroxiredoxin prx5 [Paecilomyces lecythidis]
MVLFGSLLGIVTPTNKGTMIAFLFLSQTGFGWALYLSIAITQMGVEHHNLGVSGGISGAVRFAAGSSKGIPSEDQYFLNFLVTAAGLPENQLPDLIAALNVGASALSKFSPSVVSAATEAMNQVYCKAIL